MRALACAALSAALLFAGATARADATTPPDAHAPPPALVRVLSQVRRAAATHDFSSLRRLMVPRFHLFFGAMDPSTPIARAIRFLRENPEALDPLPGNLDGGCYLASPTTAFCPRPTRGTSCDGYCIELTKTAGGWRLSGLGEHEN